MIINNLKEFGISKGILKEASEGLDYFLPIQRQFLDYFRVPYYDECCDIISDAGLPVSYKDNNLQYYNTNTKAYQTINITGGGSTISGIDTVLAQSQPLSTTRFINTNNYNLYIGAMGAGTIPESALKVGAEEYFLGDNSTYTSTLIGSLDLGKIKYYATGIGHEFEGKVKINSLSTSLSAPVTTGITKMVISDNTGNLSFTDVPTSNTPNLQAVTDVGNTTTQSITVIGIGKKIGIQLDNLYAISLVSEQLRSTRKLFLEFKQNTGLTKLHAAPTSQLLDYYLPANLTGAYFLTTSVNGNVADSAGNITIPSGGVATLTTTGITGSATLIGTTLNIPNYGANLSGTNTGDNAINSQYSSLVSNATHTGDVIGNTVLTLATVNSNVGTFTNANVTVNAKGLVTSITSGGVTNITKAQRDAIASPVQNQQVFVTDDGGYYSYYNNGWVENIPLVANTKSANYTLTTVDNYIDAIVAGITLTLFSAIGNRKEILFTNSSSDSVFISTADSIGNFTTTTNYTLGTDKFLKLKSNGTGWKIINAN